MTILSLLNVGKCLLRRKEKRRLDIEGGENKVRSSYDVLKMKYAASKLEMEELRTELWNTKIRNEEFAFFLQDIIEPDIMSEV